MSQIGFSLQAEYGLPLEQVISTLKKAGFSAVSPAWTEELDMDLLCRQGMPIQSLHAPHKGNPALWEPGSAPEVENRIFRCLEDCNRYAVPVMVIHGWTGRNYVFPEGPLDFRFFDSLVERAGQLGVCIAFENLEGEEYLAALLHRYSDAHIGYCWDSGHDHCYPHKTDFLKAYGHRLMMTHLNDNFGLRDPNGVPSGNDDLHFLPYDGNLNWEQAIGRLKGLPKQEILNFELKIRSHSTAPADLIYQNLSPEDFFMLAARRARRIADLYDKQA